MRQIFFIIALICFGINSSVAQKTIQKEFSSEGIKTLSIKDDAIFKITVHASEEKSIKLAVHISGEHSENVIVEENVTENTLSLKTDFSPFFLPEDDKLAAHKVMAVEVDLTIPQTISLEIKSKLAAVTAEGKIYELAVSIEDGTCVLTNFTGNAHLKTTDGNIRVRATSTVSGQATSTHGTVENKLGGKGKFLVEAESINGDISLLQTE